MVIGVFESQILPFPPTIDSEAPTSSFPVETSPILGFLKTLIDSVFPSEAKIPISAGPISMPLNSTVYPSFMSEPTGLIN